MSESVYDLFFTGRDDPRRCIVIGEDTKPVFLCFETPESSVVTGLRTMIVSKNKDVVAVLEWSPGNHLGKAVIGHHHLPMSHFVLPGSSLNARSFVSAEGKTFEWRRCIDNSTSYDLYELSPNKQVTQLAAFRRYSIVSAVGKTHGLLQYRFNHDQLLMESLIALCLNRWIDMHGM